MRRADHTSRSRQVAALEVAAEDRSRGSLPSESRRIAERCLIRDGFVQLDGVFDRQFLAALAKAFERRFAGGGEEAMRAAGVEVGPRRYMVPMTFESGSTAVELCANPLSLSLARSRLGEELVLDSVTVVVALPGAGPQHIHRDPLLPKSLADDCLAVSLAVPLVALDEAMGGTAYFPGSHHLPDLDPKRLDLRRANLRLLGPGSCVLMDYRLFHAGTPNYGDKPRPIVYVVYARPSFTDHANFVGVPRYILPSDELEKIPSELRPLFARAQLATDLVDGFPSCSESQQPPLRPARGRTPPRLSFRAIAQNLLIEHDLGVLADCFATHGIDLVVLKGIPLALRLFGKIDAREMVDNDLLVHRADAERAFSLLEGLGYKSVDGRQIERELDHDHEFRLARPLPGDGWLGAELHWNCFAQDLYPVPEPALWRHTEVFHWKNRTINVFDRPLTLVHLAAHFAQADFAVPQTLGDVAQAWNLWYSAGQNPDEALALARETGLIHALDFALLSAHDLGWLSGSPPGIASPRAKRLRRLLPAQRLWSARPSHDYVRWLLALLLVEPRRIPGRLSRLVFPPLDNLAVIEGKPVSRALYLRYLTRPFRPVMRALGGGSD